MHGKFQNKNYIFWFLDFVWLFFQDMTSCFLTSGSSEIQATEEDQVFLILYWTSLYSWSIFQYTTADCTRHYGITLNGFNLNLFTVYLNSIIVNWHCKYSVCLYYNWINQIVSIINMYPSSWGQRYRMKISNDQIWSWQKEGLCKLNAPHKQDI